MRLRPLLAATATLLLLLCSQAEPTTYKVKSGDTDWSIGRHFGVSEHSGPTMFARIGVMRALHRNKPKTTPAPRRKRAKAYRIIR